MSNGSKEFVLRGRVTEVLNALATLWPELSVTVDFWRLAVISQSDDYSDQQTERWIRIAESVPAFFLSTVERWYQKEEGVIRTHVNWLITKQLYGIEPSDHIILNGEGWMVTEATEQSGVAKMRIDRVKSRFVMPARTAAVNRQLTIKANIQ
jgi:hypothetical protein